MCNVYLNRKTLKWKEELERGKEIDSLTMRRGTSNHFFYYCFHSSLILSVSLFVKSSVKFTLLLKNQLVFSGSGRYS
jgi:hypothetical protein